MKKINKNTKERGTGPTVQPEGVIEQVVLRNYLGRVVGSQAHTCDENVESRLQGAEAKRQMPQLSTWQL